MCQVVSEASRYIRQCLLLAERFHHKVTISGALFLVCTITSPCGFVSNLAVTFSFVAAISGIGILIFSMHHIQNWQAVPVKGSGDIQSVNNTVLFG